MPKLKKLAAGLLLGLLLVGCSSVSGNISMDDAKVKAESFINSKLLSPGVKATVTSITEKSGLYYIKIELDENGQKRSVDSYVTQDGKFFFPQTIDMSDTDQQEDPDSTAASGDNTVSLAEIPKTDKPVIDVFVMSHCPFGTQIEKGILPAVKALGSEIDFKLRFVDYAMHGEKELQEQMRQVAIRENAPEKLIPYLEKFLEAGDAAAAATAAGLDANKLAGWTQNIDNQFGVMKKFADKTTWSNGSYPPFEVDAKQNTAYSVQGSPTLVINGKVVEGVGRDAASLLAAVCAGFQTAPAACQAKLSAESPTAGFGYDTGKSDAAAGSCS